jgi:hypothetical protein
MHFPALGNVNSLFYRHTLMIFNNPV